MRGWGWGRAARNRANSPLAASAICTTLEAFLLISVEPRGFEVRTAALQSQSLMVARVRRCSKLPAKSRICLWKHLCLFAVVHMSSCTPGVNELQRTPRLSPFYLFSSRFRGPPQDPNPRAPDKKSQELRCTTYQWHQSF